MPPRFKKKMAPGAFATRGLSQRVDSRKGAFAPNFSSWQPIALSTTGFGTFRRDEAFVP
jgi:hypothetical protein